MSEQLPEALRCEKCKREESEDLKLYVTSFRPGFNPLLCKTCGDGDWGIHHS